MDDLANQAQTFDIKDYQSSHPMSHVLGLGNWKKRVGKDHGFDLIFKKLSCLVTDWKPHLNYAKAEASHGLDSVY